MHKGKVFLFLFLTYTFQIFGQNTLVKTSDDDVFRTGIELLNHEKYGAAREFFQRYVDLNKNDLKSIDAEYYIAYSAMNLFHPDAEILFEQFTTKYPYHSKSSLAYYELANFNFNNKKYDKAISFYEKVDPLRLSNSQRLERSFRMGYSYFGKKEFEKAEPYFNEVKSSSSKHSFAASYYAGYIELKNAKYEEALADLKKAEEAEGYKTLVPVMIANVYYKQEKYDEVINYSEKVFKREDFNNLQGKDDIYLFAADAYFKKNNYAKSAEYFKKNKSKTSADIIYRMALSEYKTNDFDSAINDFKIIGGNKDSVSQSASYYLGLSYLKKANNEFALAAFDLAKSVSFNIQTQEEAHFNAGKVNFDLKRYHDAIVTLKSFSKEFPNSKHNAEVQELLSEAFLRTNNFAEALAYIESLKARSTRINTAYQRVSFHSGVQAYNNGKFEEAIKLFEKSSEFSYDKDIYLAVHFWKGEAFSVLKDYNSAIRNYSIVFQNSAQGNEYFLKSRYGIGYAYFNTKQYDKAFPHFKNYVESLKRASDKQFYDDALLRLADLNYQSKNYNEAIRYYTEAISAKISDLDYAYYQRGVVYGIIDNTAEAKNNLDVVIRNYPQSVYHDDAIFEKAQINSQLGNFEETISGFTKIIKEKEGSPYVPYALVKRAVAYSNVNKDNEAISDYENILTNYISHPVTEDAFIGLQNLYEKTGRTEEFKKWIDVMEQSDPKNTLLVTARYTDAKNLFFAQKYKQAIDAFTNYLNQYGDNSNADEARFYLADSYSGLGDYDNAIKSYKAVINPANPAFFARAILRVADIQNKRGNYSEAKVYYNLLLLNARNKKDKLTALNNLMDIHYKTANYDSTIYYASEIRNSGNANIDAESKALLYAGKSYYAKEDYEKAIDNFISTINLAKDRNGAEAQYLIGEIQFKQKKYRQSLETLYQLNNLFSDYEDWVGKAFLLVSDNFISMNEVFQAKATLNSIIENSTHLESVQKAKDKLLEIEKNEAVEGKEKENNE